MSSKDILRSRESGFSGMTQKLMEHGFVCPESSCTLSMEVRRGMPILSEEGQEVGKVAAVILDEENQKATHLLLSRLPEIKGYWLVPVNLILQVRDGTVRLGVPRTILDRLPIWCSGD